MKVKKALALLLVLPVLGGCSKEKVSEPSFKPYSNEVTNKVFVEKYSEAREANDFVKKMNTIPVSPLAGEFKYNTSSKSEFAFKGENKGESTFESASEGVYKHDVKNSRYFYETSSSDKIEAEFKKSGNSSSESSDKGKRYVGYQTVNEVETCVFYDYYQQDAAEIRSYVTKTSISNTMAGVEKNSFASQLPSVSSVEDYEDLSESDKAEYKFYVDESVYTIVMEGERENYILGNGGAVIGKVEQKVRHVRQFELAASSFFYAEYELNEYKIKFSGRGTYLYGDYRFDVEDGDSLESVESSSKVYEASFDENYEVATVEVATAA